MRSMELWELPTPVLRIEGKGSGYWPTPNAAPLSNDLNLQCSGDGRQKPNKLGWAVAVNTPSGNWPTPTCSDAFTDKLKSAQQSEGSMHSVNLSQAVKMWPTPCASEMRTMDKEQLVKRREQAKDKAKNGNGFGLNLGNAMTMEGEVGGQLNPDWVEWLMDWPIGWTSMEPLNPDRFLAWLRASPSAPIASKPSATAKCQPPQSSHGIPSTNELKRA